ncbi:MAG: hypothetical protein ACM3QZ_05220 [Solirubrobacterales bacterium]
MKRNWVYAVFFLLFLSEFSWQLGFYHPTLPRHTHLVRPAYDSIRVVLLPNEVEAINRGWRWARRTGSVPLRWPDYQMYYSAGRVDLWLTERVGQDQKGRTFRLPPAAVKLIAGAAARLENGIGDQYGELMMWDDASKYFPKFGKATVVDCETRATYQVQRRGGTYHADVQPLTAEDTRIMKQIYGGSWSWSRRPVIVVAGGHRIAASMNGKPHGGGLIKGNNFPGHSCIHFLGSRLHLNTRVDLRHQLCVIQAAGRSEPEVLARLRAAMQNAPEHPLTDLFDPVGNCE